MFHLEHHSDVYVASLDQKAAFETVRVRADFLKIGILCFTGQFLMLLMPQYSNLKAVLRIAGFSCDIIMAKRSVRHGSMLSTFLCLVYVNCLFNDLEISGYGSTVMLVQCQCDNPTFTEDISLAFAQND